MKAQHMAESGLCLNEERRSSINELYVLSEPGVSDIICEIACINHHFFLAIFQTFPADEFIGVFLGELASVGIGYEVVGKEPLRLCGIREYDNKQEKPKEEKRG